MAPPVLVTGAAGNVGGAVARSLQAAGQAVRLADLDPARLADLAEPALPMVRLDFEDPTSFDPALEGAGALFLVRPPNISRVGPTLNVLIDRALAAGVEHIVFSSVSGAENNPVLPHHRVERHLKAATNRWTLLRPGFFAQNLGGPYRQDIRDDSRIYLPAGNGRVAFIDVRDLGDVAAEVFAHPVDHRRRAYTLTGPEAVTLDRVARILSAELQRPVSYQPASVAGYLRHLRRHRDLPWAQILVQTLLHVGLRRGDAENVDPTLGRLLGRRPRSMADYVHDHRTLWERPAVPQRYDTVPYPSDDK